VIRFAGLFVCFALVGCGPNRLWAGKSPDRAHTVEVWAHRDTQFVRVDGRDEPRFAGIGIDGLSWSPDSRHFAYPANTPAGWVVIAKGQTSGPWLGIGEIVWSADSKHFAYSAQEPRFWAVVKDFQTGPYYDAIMQRSLVFSPNGSSLGYVVQDGRWTRAVVDDKPGPKFDGIGRLTFSADSKHHVYLARRVDASFFVVDGESSTAYDSIADVVLSPAGFHWAILVRIDGFWHAVVDDTAGPAFDSIASPVFSAMGDRIAYSARRDKNAVVVVDGKESAAFDEIRWASVVFDPEARHIGFTARRGTRWRVVVDGQEGKEYDDVSVPVLAGDTIAYVASRADGDFAVINGVEGAVFGNIGNLELTPDGRHHGYVTMKSNESFVVIDSVAKKFDVIVDNTLVLSANGRHWACIIGDAGRKKFYITIDGSRNVPLDREEWLAALVPSIHVPGLIDGNDQNAVVRGWVAAQLARHAD
jgi:hypothetical protein